MRSISEFIKLWFRILGSNTAKCRNSTSVTEYFKKKENEIEEADLVLIDELTFKTFVNVFKGPGNGVWFVIELKERSNLERYLNEEFDEYIFEIDEGFEYEEDEYE